MSAELPVPVRLGCLAFTLTVPRGTTQKQLLGRARQRARDLIANPKFAADALKSALLSPYNAGAALSPGDSFALTLPYEYLLMRFAFESEHPVASVVLRSTQTLREQMRAIHDCLPPHGDAAWGAYRFFIGARDVTDERPIAQASHVRVAKDGCALYEFVVGPHRLRLFLSDRTRVCDALARVREALRPRRVRLQRPLFEVVSATGEVTTVPAGGRQPIGAVCPARTVHVCGDAIGYARVTFRFPGRTQLLVLERGATAVMAVLRLPPFADVQRRAGGGQRVILRHDGRQLPAQFDLAALPRSDCVLVAVVPRVLRFRVDDAALPGVGADARAQVAALAFDTCGPLRVARALEVIGGLIGGGGAPLAAFTARGAVPREAFLCDVHADGEPIAVGVEAGEAPAPAQRPVALAFALKCHPDRTERFDAGACVADARRRIAAACEVAPEDVVLLLGGKALGDALALARLPVPDGERIHICLRTLSEAVLRTAEPVPLPQGVDAFAFRSVQGQFPDVTLEFDPGACVADAKARLCERCAIADPARVTLLNGDDMLDDCAELADVRPPGATFDFSVIDAELAEYATLREKGEEALDGEEEARFFTAKTNMIDQVDDEEYRQIEASKGTGMTQGDAVATYLRAGRNLETVRITAELMALRDMPT